MKKRIFLSIAMAFLSCSVAMAASGKVFLTEKNIEAATYQACSLLPHLEPETLIVDKLRAGIFPSPLFTDLLSHIQENAQRKSFDVVVKENNLDQFFDKGDASIIVLNNDGYLRALHRCYGNNDKPKEIFHMAILKADLRGKSLTGISFVGMLYIGFKLFSLLPYLPQIIQYMAEVSGTFIMVGDWVNENNLMNKKNKQDEEDQHAIQQICDGSTSDSEGHLVIKFDCVKRILESCVQLGYEEGLSHPCLQELIKSSHSL